MNTVNYTDTKGAIETIGRGAKVHESQSAGINIILYFLTDVKFFGYRGCVNIFRTYVLPR